MSSKYVGDSVSKTDALAIEERNYEAYAVTEHLLEFHNAGFTMRGLEKEFPQLNEVDRLKIVEARLGITPSESTQIERGYGYQSPLSAEFLAQQSPGHSQIPSASTRELSWRDLHPAADAPEHKQSQSRSKGMEISI